jgi:AcrR family transcriptional regulator
MSTRAIEKSTDKRQAILDAALKLFCERCFQETSTASISQSAGVATGTLFLYFENKEELVNELYLACKDEYATYLEDGVWEHKSFKTRLKYIWDRSITWHLKNTDKVNFMRQFCTSPLITKMTREKALNRLNIINEVVKKATETHEISASMAELYAALIPGYIHSSAMRILEINPGKNLNKWIEEGFNFIWNGIKD